jgi:hypothetical protein
MQGPADASPATFCGLLEVRCVLVFMDGQNAETLAAYRKGDFARAATPALNVAEIAR